MFFARLASLRDSPNSLTASTVMSVSSIACRSYSESESFSSGLSAVAGLAQVAAGEVVGVDDDRRALLDVRQVGLEGGRVHRDQHVGGVPGREDVVVGEVHLEGRDTGQRALRGADLRGEVGQRRQVVAEGRGLLREAVTGELHAVTGVAGEPDDHAIELLDLFGHGLRRLPSARVHGAEGAQVRVPLACPCYGGGEAESGLVRMARPSSGVSPDTPTCSMGEIVTPIE